MYGTKLHDSQDLECKIGEKTIGTLYTPVYKGKSVILRKLDQWSGIQEIERCGFAVSENCNRYFFDYETFWKK